MNFLICLLIPLFFIGYENNKSISGIQGNEFIEIRLLPGQTYQTIHNFGASDCWSGQFIGNWPDEDKNKIADLLFSMQVDENGNPVGIGLSCWRFNIGGGSAEQGTSSNIGDEWRRAPGFLNNNGTYDWEALSSQRWLMRAAKERGCEQFIGFLNSPPVQWTKNGKAYSSDGESGNLKLGNYARFAGYLADVVDNINRLDGIEFDYVSPFNEPQWDWMTKKNGLAGQEGSPWLNEEIKAICVKIDSAFSAQDLKTKIEISESAKLSYLYETSDKPKRANQIEDFFSPSSANYVGGLKHMAPKIAGHSYFTTWGDDTLVHARQKVAEKIAEIRPGLEFWMSEYCILENNELIKGNGKNLGIGPALYNARVIHADLVFGNASAWHWWLAISPYNYKDGLVYIDKSKTGGKIEESKMLWGLGNFSRFIVPGSKRIGIWRSDQVPDEDLNGLMVSGYETPGGKCVCVLVNPTGKTYPVKATLNQKKATKITAYITSDKKDENLSKTIFNNPNGIVDIPAKSIATLVLEPSDVLDKYDTY